MRYPGGCLGVSSDVLLLVDQHRAAGQSSVHLDLLRVGHRYERVVLQLLKHLQGQRPDCKDGDVAFVTTSDKRCHI